MSLWILKRDDGAYVRPGGEQSSYSRRLQDAKTFATREEAEREACGNEHAVTVEGEMR